jgi:hypothetical protein
MMVANAPLVYREVISTALKELRPHLEVFTSQPGHLERGVQAPLSPAGGVQPGHAPRGARGARLDRALL